MMNQFEKIFIALLEFLQSDSIFWFCALAGSGMFLIQCILNLFSSFGHEGLDADRDLSDLPDEVDVDYADARKFKWLSMQTITGFLMMFGLSALTCQEYGLHNAITITIALAVGILTAYIMRFFLKLAKKCVSSGSVYNIEDAIDKEAYVYQRIPKGGRGKISITLKQLTHEIHAISDHTEELPSFMRVKVIEKSDGDTVIVTPL